MMHGIRHVHFVGLGGAGMSGIAEILLQQGYRVSGSDSAASDTLTRLGRLGVLAHVGHAAEHITGAQVLVTSTAIAKDNPEVLAAQQHGIPVLARADMLAELMRRQQGIAVAGTHGKTTTTSLVTSVLIEGGRDPTFVIGGVLHSAGVSARLGVGSTMVVEADESDASFLKLPHVMAVVTNIDADHMETYGQSFDALKDAFVTFVQRLPFYGRAVVCVDDAAVRCILPRLARPVVTYGTSADAQVRAVNLRAVGTQMHFTAQRRGHAVVSTGVVGEVGIHGVNGNGGSSSDIDIELNLTGEHNVRNALAAIALAHELGVPDFAVHKALREFSGVARRFQRYGELEARTGGLFTLVDDYGHHPVEVQATLAAARSAFTGRRLVLAFQPHRYTRTRDCFAAFARVLAQADVLLLADVYPAGEDPIAGADSQSLNAAVQAAGLASTTWVGPVSGMAGQIEAHAQGGDVVLCMGAGSIGLVAAELTDLLQNDEQHVEEG